MLFDFGCILRISYHESVTGMFLVVTTLCRPNYGASQREAGIYDSIQNLLGKSARETLELSCSKRGNEVVD